jgi:hypothetical protein
LEWGYEVIAPLRALPGSWDSYRAAPLNDAVADLGTNVFASLALLDVTPPQVFPTADGGLSLEWHRPDLDFVISLSPPWDEPPTAYFRTADQEWEASDIFRVPDPRFDVALSALREG